MGQAAGGQGDDRNSMEILWIIFLIFAIGAGVWYFFSEQLQTAFLFVREWELAAVSFFLPNYEELYRYTQGLSPSSVDANLATELSIKVGSIIRWPLGAITLLGMAHLFFGHLNLRFNKAHDMESLTKQEQRNWPQIAPVVKLDLVKQDIHTGPWAMAMTPLQFAKHHKVLKIERMPSNKAAWKAEAVGKATVLREHAQRVFYLQLGSLWKGVNHLPPHTKALFAVFAARAEHDVDTARAMLTQLSQSYAEGRLDYDGVDALIKKHQGSKVVKRVLDRHAYVFTVMASLLELARVDGVLASADFLWVKPVDRRLWYTLSCVGRQVAYSEVGGIFAHWHAERNMGRPLAYPVVDAAVNALERAIAGILYVLSEEEEKTLAEGEST